MSRDRVSVGDPVRRVEAVGAVRMEHVLPSSSSHFRRSWETCAASELSERRIVELAGLHASSDRERRDRLQRRDGDRRLALRLLPARRQGQRRADERAAMQLAHRCSSAARLVADLVERGATPRRRACGPRRPWRSRPPARTSSASRTPRQAPRGLPAPRYALGPCLSRAGPSPCAASVLRYRRRGRVGGLRVGAGDGDLRPSPPAISTASLNSARVRRSTPAANRACSSSSSKLESADQLISPPHQLSRSRDGVQAVEGGRAGPV